MSYCRFTEGDVYAYECDGGVQFWTAGEGLNRLCNTFNDAYQYAMFLRDGYGLDVPSHAIEALKADALDEARRICGSGSAVAELEHENAKLRELVVDLYKALFSLNLDHCQACPREDACVFMHKSFDCDECAFEYDMRELGVEVDG